jgi:hypothetical protein
VLGADRIVFLGFAFHDQNMGILAGEASIKTKPMIGTAFGMSESDVRVVKQQIGRWTGMGARPGTDDGVDLQTALKAADIFNFYSKTL